MVRTKPTHGTESTSAGGTVRMLDSYRRRCCRPGSSVHAYTEPPERFAVLCCVTCLARFAQIHSCTLVTSQSE
jgi:hypothetical protein